MASTSTSATPAAPESLLEIQKLFSWNPPTLVLDTTRKRSTATRRPSFFDKHISQDLVLKSVKKFPSLVQDLVRNVDTALTAALSTLPPLDRFITAQQRDDDIWTTPPTVTDEKGVANFYDKTTAKYCSRVASTLALHPFAPFSGWISLLFWTQSVSHSGYAIIDGQLCFLGEKGLTLEQKKQRSALMETLDNTTREIFEEMAKSRSALGTWEIMSISAGSIELMTEVPNLGNFGWTTCTDPKCLKKHKKRRAKVALLSPAGPDALRPPWNLPDSSSTLQPLPVYQRLTRSAAKSSSSTLPSSSARSSEAPITGSKRRERDNDNDRPEPPRKHKQANDNGVPAFTNNKGKEPQRDDDNYESYPDQHDISAHSLVQQAWAQAVDRDGTVIVLHSGNHELVCIRHRKSQTLYVSEVIEPPECTNPGYGKLQVGIYLAAIQDTIDRKQRPQPNPPGGSGDLLGGDQGSAGKSVPTDGELEKMIHIASHCDLILLYLQYNVYDSPVPATFLRSATSIIAHTRCPTPPFSPRAIQTYGLEECQTIVLTSKIGHGATGVVLRGTLKPEIWDAASTLDVVVKLAFDTKQRASLRGEHDVYRRLRSQGVHSGITTPLGFFDDSEGSACALVMPYAGVPLSELHRNLSISECDSVLSTLQFIHRAGILHGDICPENILVGDSGITIIDFGHSKQSDNKRLKDNEFARLRILVTSCS